ncbi:hypothetical protein FRC01_010592 [Tulasnella sp. 417]|nr:hypothetical protein FRC01_010592 [Tulasnella sp. 417]
MLLRISLFLTVLATVSAASKHPKTRAIAPRDDSPIDDGLLELVRQRARDTSLRSWELGTLAEAFLELDWPHLSVFGENGVPPPRDGTGPNNLTTVLQLANYALAIRPEGIVTLFADGAVGDPPSLGVAVLLANWTKASHPGMARNNYDTPLRQQMDYVINEAPRTDDGAISHRSERVQLWSDFIYMAPPFMAYYAALHQPTVDRDLLYESYNQIKLYRNYMFDEDPGLWKHILMGNFQDEGHWGTGNGWAAAGIMRVLCTINQTTLGYDPDFVAAQRDLQNWATEIVNNAWKFQQSSIDAAVRARDLIRSRINPNDGWVDQVVDPYAWGSEGKESPEGQSFVLLMEAAWRGWRSYLDSVDSPSSSSESAKPTATRTTSTVTEEVTVTLTSEEVDGETQGIQQATITGKTSTAAGSTATATRGSSNRGSKVCRRKLKNKHLDL